MTFCSITYIKFKADMLEEYRKLSNEFETMASLYKEYNIEQIIIGTTNEEFHISIALWNNEVDYREYLESEYRNNIYQNFVELQGDTYRFSVIINEIVETKILNIGYCRLVRYRVKKGMVTEYIQEYNKLSESQYLKEIGVLQTLLLSDRDDMTSMGAVTIWESKEAMLNYKNNPKRSYLIDNYLEDFRILGIFEIEKLIYPK